MILDVSFVLIFLMSVAYAAAVMRRMEGDVVAFQRESRQSEEENQRLEVACTTLRGMLSEAEGEVGRIQGELATVAEAKEKAEVELAAAMNAPKDRLYILDKSSLSHARLWEVATINDMARRHAHAPGWAEEWMQGRTVLVGATTDRDARQRVEMRFPSSQGYRTMKAERFRRN
ncbi:hypothetical protein HHL28_14385 [Aerophototrophica crusticola]|uniref:Uncharacterized protein n=1 Tax=Aerophototrophica crusticola TaxID=1709002 RepID=A0A858R9H3_9PROT|nr:hypothetical protein HHL28_14385 [Rhodospirillaceae bacterium B3]